MPTYRCRVLAFVDDDFLKLGHVPFELAGDHDPQANFICLLEKEVAEITGDPAQDISTVLADERLREALADRLGLTATRWLAMRGGTCSIETARREIRKALASWHEGVTPPIWE